MKFVTKEKNAQGGIVFTGVDTTSKINQEESEDRIQESEYTT
ncbi:hypothetical protein [Aetokthonos hydrillicola]|jgi:hypothetical protein|nr:hypothetical protein [Aetokthonos hydrillicola]